MGYAQLDDRYHDHAKVKLAFREAPAAIAIHVMAITYCSLHNTDGRVPAHQIDEWLGRLSCRSKQKLSILNALLEHKLLDYVDGKCYEVHDYLHWNRSKADRKLLAEYGRKGGKSRKHRVSENEAGSLGLAEASGGVEASASEVAKARQRQRHEREEAKASSSRVKASEEDRRLCRLLAELAKQRNPKFLVKSEDRWLTEMRRLRERDGNAPEEIERAIRWLFTDAGEDANFWADVIQSPANLREHFPKVWAKMRGQGRVAAVEDSASFLARRSAA